MNDLQWVALGVGLPSLALLVVQSLRISRRDAEIRRLRQQIERLYLGGLRDRRQSEHLLVPPLPDLRHELRDDLHRP